MNPLSRFLGLALLSCLLISAPVARHAFAQSPIQLDDELNVPAIPLPPPPQPPPGAKASEVSIQAPWNKSPFKARSEEECTPLTVDERFFGRGRNQGQIGWCFAYSLSDLATYCVANAQSPVDASGQKVAPTEVDFLRKYRISAFDVALGYAAPGWKKAPKHDLESLRVALNSGGLPGEAFKRMVDRGGYCTDAQLTSDPESLWFLVKYLAEREKASGTGDTYQKLFAEMPSPDSSSKGTMWLLTKLLNLRKEATSKGTPDCLTGDKTCFHTLGKVNSTFSNEGFAALLAESKDENFLEKLDEKLCTRRNPFPTQCSKAYTYFADSYWRETPDNIQPAGHSLFPVMDTQLAQGKPVGFSVESHFLQASDGKDTGRNGGHAMIILGREWKDGECRYKVRNSWKGWWDKKLGDARTMCSGYNKEFVKGCEDDQEKTLEPIVTVTKREYEETVNGKPVKMIATSTTTTPNSLVTPGTGYFWVSEETLRKNFWTVTYLGDDRSEYRPGKR